MNEIEIMVTCPQCHRDNHAHYCAAYCCTDIYCAHCFVVHSSISDRDLIEASGAVQRMIHDMLQLGEHDDIPWVIVPANRSYTLISEDQFFSPELGRTITWRTFG